MLPQYGNFKTQLNVKIQILKYILYVYGIRSCLFLLDSLENVCQIVHDSATLELEFAATGAAQ